MQLVLAELTTFLLHGVVEVTARILLLDLLLDPPVRCKVRDICAFDSAPTTSYNVRTTMRPSLAKTTDPGSPAENGPCLLSQAGPVPLGLKFMA